MVKDYLDTYMTPLFEDEIKKGGLRGASLWIKKSGETVYKKHFGTDKDDAIYRIFSMTKPITSTCAFILYERGQLDIMTPLREYLPWFSEMKVIDEKGKVRPCEKDILIKNLLDMTSGIVYPGESDPAERAMAKELEKIKKRRKKGEDVTGDDVAQAIAASPLAFAPGERWRYGASADILGMVIEKISGMTLGEFMKKEIFEPLCMTDTGFCVPRDKVSRIADMYGHDKDGKLRVVSAKGLSSLFAYIDGSCHTIEAGGSGLYSTLDDYMKFVDMLFGFGSSGDKRILGKNTVEFMRTPQLTREQYDSMYFECAWGYSYGNLMRTLVDKAVGATNGSIGEFGWDGLAGTYMMVDPKADIELVYMQQISDGIDFSLRRRMRQIVYAADDRS